MATPSLAWPADFAYQYTESLALARRISRLAQASVEQGIGGTHNIYFLRRWLRLMRLHAGAIQNYLMPIYQQRSSTDRMGNWVLDALRECPDLADEIVENVRRAERLVKSGNPNLEGAEAAISVAWDAAQQIEKLLLAGPGPVKGDVLDQVREVIETLEE